MCPLFFYLQDSRVGTEYDVTFLFDLLFEALAKMATSSKQSSSVVHSTSTTEVEYKLILCEIFESRLIREAFLPVKEPPFPDDFDLYSSSSRKHKQKKDTKSKLPKQRRNTDYTLLFNEKVGELVRTGVRHFPEVKTYDSIKFIAEQLLQYLSFFFKNACLEEEIIGNQLSLCLCVFNREHTEPNVHSIFTLIVHLVFCICVPIVTVEYPQSGHFQTLFELRLGSIPRVGEMLWS